MKRIKRILEQGTTKAFTRIHIDQFNKKIFSRLSVLSTDYLQVNKNFFKNKVCLDAASGLNAHASVRLLKMGAKHVHLFDMNSQILKVTKKFLEKKFSKKRFTIKRSNLLKIDYPSNYFDFVHCRGAIHHSVDYKKSLKELCRVTKKGGTLYFEYDGVGGIVQEVVDFLRVKYKKDKLFKHFIDNLNKNTFRNILKFISIQNSRSKIKMFSKSELKNFLTYFDYDVILTLKDRIQPPVLDLIKYKTIEKILKSNGFYKIKRLTFFPFYTNYRKFLSPFYEAYNNYYSKMLYGDGLPKIICKKK